MPATAPVLSPLLLLEDAEGEGEGSATGERCSGEELEVEKVTEDVELSEAVELGATEDVELRKADDEEGSVDALLLDGVA